MKKLLLNYIVFAVTVICITNGGTLCRNGVGFIEDSKECTVLPENLKITKQTILPTKTACCPKCYTPDGQLGVCKSVNECPQLIKMINNLTNSNMYYLIHSRCDTNGNEIKLYCGPPRSNVRARRRCRQMSAFPPLPNSGCCGVEAITTSFNRITGGSTTAIDQFPWLVLLEYRDNYRIETYCGGSLISGKYVLTAAHCVIKTKATNYKLPISVRVGEYDTSNFGPDCVDIGNGIDCTDPAVSIPIETRIIHPDYKSFMKRNDIAIIRLKYVVKFTDFVRPICLPYNSSFSFRPKLEVAGWGKTRFNGSASQKQYVQVPLVDIMTCQFNYNNMLNTKRQIWKKQLCAGGEPGKDACSGDSGGPLMYERTYGGKKVNEVLGLVSYGPKQCGTEGLPGIYTNVNSYVTWIRSNIRP